MALGKYTSRLKKCGRYEPSFCYLMDTLLQSRIATDHESNKEYFDEDVNVYLALLLNSIVTDRFHRISTQFIARHEVDLPEILDRAENMYMKHEIYRMNGDFLLLQTGLFRIPRRADDQDDSLAAAIERGRTYYRFACSFGDRIPDRYRTVTDVLAKLSYGFDKYRVILNRLRGEFLGLVEPMSNDDVGHLVEGMDRIDREERARQLQDELLDAYIESRRDGRSECRAAWRAKLDELRAIDPNAWSGLVGDDESDEPPILDS